MELMDMKLAYTGRRPGWVMTVTVVCDWCDFHFNEFLFNMEDWKTLLTKIVFYDDIFCSAPSYVYMIKARFSV